MLNNTMKMAMFILQNGEREFFLVKKALGQKGI